MSEDTLRESVSIYGRLDPIRDGWVSGWVLDTERPQELHWVEVLVDDEVAGVAACNLPRRTNGTRHAAVAGSAFRLRLPDRHLDGRAHLVRARIEGLSLELSGSPRAAILGTPQSTQALGPFARETVVDVEGSFDSLAARLRRGGRLAIVAVHQPTGRAPRYLRRYLENLKALDHAVVVVNAAAEPAANGHAAATRCSFDGLADVSVWRRNRGWDFASWIVALDRLRTTLPTLERLILANDSVFGPLYDLSEAVSRMSSEPCDFWGITDSWEHRYHLQSYFLVFKSAALRSEAFARFLADYPLPLAKEAVIRHGETSLTRALLDGGLRAGVLCPYPKVAEAWLARLPERFAALRDLPEAHLVDPAYMAGSHGPWGHHGQATYRHFLAVACNARLGVPMNPTHFFWDTLLTDLRSPFLKRDLLLWNPMHVPNLAEARSLVEKHTEFPYDDVVEAAQQLAGTRCPVMPPPAPLTAKVEEPPPAAVIVPSTPQRRGLFSRV